jgi:hypothetical protein
MRVAKSGYFFVCCALLFVLCADGASARGKYQRTEDRKALVWNNLPKIGAVVSWSGDHESDGYATGRGTLTWYKTDRALLTGFNLPKTTRVVVSRYSGKMVHGKFNGMVTSEIAEGKRFHAAFKEGRRTGKWAAGAAPSAAPEKPREEQVQRAVAVTSETEPPAPGAGPATIAEQSPPPVAAANTDMTDAPPRAIAITKPVDQPVTKPENKTGPAKPAIAKPAAAQKSSDDMDDSLKSLVGPPALLRAKGAAAAPPKASEPSKISAPPASTPAIAPASPPAAHAGPRLSATEVIELANAEARKQGYHLDEYHHPQADYTEADGAWSVSYDQTNADGAGNRFSVSVEDKTKKTSVVPDR